MIAVSSSGRSFRALAAYLASGRSGEERERVAWSVGRNLPTDDLELAAIFMRATAAQSNRVEKPVYHVALSFDPSDNVDRATMERVAAHVLDRLGLAEHQAVIVAHRDRDHAHVHIIVNRVHPETGNAWERWKDQPLIQQVLREEERRLGLREVRGTLVPGVEQDIPSERAVNLGEHTNARDTRTPRRTRVVQAAEALENHERVINVTREQYHAQIDSSTAHTRLSHIDAEAERARVAVASFDRVLASVYRDPERAHREYFAMVEKNGVRTASHEMHQRPERFGALVTVDRMRAFGLVRDDDASQARALALVAAAKGRDAIATLRDFGKVAAEMHARRLEDAFMRELHAMYEEPVSARAAFDRLAMDCGADQAANALRERPSQFGHVRAPIRRDESELAQHAVRAAELGLEATAARHSARSADATTWNALVESEPKAARIDAERAAAREATVRRALTILPGRTELERRIAGLVERMTPHEVRQLRRTVTAPRFALAMEIRTTIRDVALGRDDEPQR